ncbi:hypothetical protein ABZ802_03985 [Streptomyces sp. NPDC047737]|jgi:hypothetical protein|uniref:hypothetical protein n=1 Tax=unclassified Streptomyces TaxID=2593676 RepID=UPI0033C2B746
MPRPTAAQISFGSATVVFSALAMLLLFRAESGVAVAAVCTAALVLGLLVAMSVPARTRTARRVAPVPSSVRAHRTIEDIEIAAAQRRRMSEHSLHR